MADSIKMDDKQIRELFASMLSKLSNPQPAMNKMGFLGVNAIRDNFRLGGAYKSADSIIGGSKRWKKHSKTTRAIKKRQGKKSPYQVLLDSGMLQKSISHRTTKDSLILSAGREYAAVQHYGAKKGEFGIFDVLIKSHKRKTRSGKESIVKSHTRKTSLPFGNIPARPFMTIPPDIFETMLDLLYKFSTEE